jgi:membrane-associated protein
MEWLSAVVDLVVHLDRHLTVFTALYGAVVYALLFAVVFAETGLVVFPFLPGDSLLFIAGSVAAFGGVDIHFLMLTLFVAACLGNLLNFEVGRWAGARVFNDASSRWLNPAQIGRTHAFFERWGAIAIVAARFVPFLRTYVPFVAGVGRMHRGSYFTYTLLGAAIWVGSLSYLGYFFGNVPWIKSHQGFLVIGIVLLSAAPVLISALRTRRTA